MVCSTLRTLEYVAVPSFQPPIEMRSLTRGLMVFKLANSLYGPEPNSLMDPSAFRPTKANVM